MESTNNMHNLVIGNNKKSIYDWLQLTKIWVDVMGDHPLHIPVAILHI